MNFSFGARIFDYGYIGLGPGIEYSYTRLDARISLVGGVELKRFAIGLGYNYMGIDEYSEGLHFGILKIGVKFGKLK